MVQLDSTPTCNESHIVISPILVMGVGNYLMSDDGAGVHVVHALQKLTLPSNIELLDAGTATMSFLSNLCNRKKVIIIDAVSSGNPPGTMYRFYADDFYMQRKAILSLHQVGIMEAVALSRFIGGSTGEIIVYGIEPGKIECGMSLSPEVEACLPKLTDRIYKELEIEIRV